MTKYLPEEIFQLLPVVNKLVDKFNDTDNRIKKERICFDLKKVLAKTEPHFSKSYKRYIQRHDGLYIIEQLGDPIHRRKLYYYIRVVSQL